MTLPNDLFKRVETALASGEDASDERLPNSTPEGAVATLRGTVPVAVRGLYLLHLEFEDEEGEFDEYDSAVSSAYGYVHIAAWNLFMLGVMDMLVEIDDPWISITRGWKFYELNEVPTDGDELIAERRPKQSTHLSLAYSRP